MRRWSNSVGTWHAALRRTIEQCKELGDLPVDADADQILSEIHGLILVLHYEARFFAQRWRLAARLDGL